MVMGDMVMTVDVVVIGSGPGGYSAAIRAAELGFDVALVDSHPRPGGSYLYEGCIPAKIYFNLAERLLDLEKTRCMGVHIPQPEIDLKKMAEWKEQLAGNLADNLHNLCIKSGVQLIQGKAFFKSSTSLRLRDSEISSLQFKHAVIASGSIPLTLPGVNLPGNSRIMTPADALKLTEIPAKMLIVGGGSAGLELATIYRALGCTIHIAEKKKRLLAGVDEDLVEPLKQNFPELFERIMLETTVNNLTENKNNIEAELQTPGGLETNGYDRVLLAIGHKPASSELGLENTCIELDENGFIPTDSKQRTAEPNIFAVGDVTNSMMLVHSAIREGRVAAEVIGDLPSEFDNRAIPQIIYTNPQIAWCGLSETEAMEQNISVTVQKLPWRYVTKAHIVGSTDGLTKVIARSDNYRIVGAGITGKGAEDLISEWVLAIEMGAVAEDIALSVHAHPSLSESGPKVSEMFPASGTNKVL